MGFYPSQSPLPLRALITGVQKGRASGSHFIIRLFDRKILLLYPGLLDDPM